MSISREVLAKYIKPGCTFIETGTRWGDTCIRAIELGAGKVFTAETDGFWWGLAQMHLRDALRDDAHKVSPNHCSGTGLMQSLKNDVNVGGRIIFLDAHTDTHSDVLEELYWIEQWAIKPEVILIDDMRCMEGWGIQRGDISSKLVGMGYKLSFENGVVPKDIMVAQL